MAAESSPKRAAPRAPARAAPPPRTPPVAPPTPAVAPPPAVKPLAPPVTAPDPRPAPAVAKPPRPVPSTGAGRIFTLHPGVGNPWPLFRHHLRSIVRARKTPFLLLALLIPMFLGLAIHAASGMEDYSGPGAIWGRPNPSHSPGLEWFEDGSYALLFPLLLPLVIAVFAAAAINEEVEGKTLPYLFTRPVYRSWILLAKVLAIMIGVFLLAITALTIFWFGSTGLTENVFKHIGELFGYWWVAGLTIFSVTGLFTFLGVLWKRSLIPIALYLIVWELFISQINFVGFFLRASLVNYERAILLEVADRGITSTDLQIDRISPEMGHFVLITVGILGLAAALYTVSKKDYNV